MSTNETLGITVNVKQLVKQLGGRLYEDPAVVIRELISNASDACLFSAAAGRRHEENYQIEVRHETESQLVISDNGRGMTRDELQWHLSVVANDQKRSECQHLREQGKGEFADRIIGEFGLGFLSSFVIADKVVVETVSETQEDFQGWQWESTGDSTYTLAPFQGKQPGTTVRLYIKRDSRYLPFAEPRFIRKQIRTYSRMITFPIYYWDGNHLEHINEIAAPWVSTGAEGEAKWRQLLSTLEDFKDTNASVSLFCFSTDDVQGVLYFPHYHATVHYPLGAVDVYCRGVLVQQANPIIVPKTVRCVKGMVQSKHFHLTLDRNNIVIDENVELIQRFIETAVLDHLKGLARAADSGAVEVGELLRKLLAIHGHILMEGCYSLEDNEAFCQLAELMPFRTTALTATTIVDYLERAAPISPRQIYYFTERLGNRQVAALVRRRRWELIDCTYPLDLIFLRRYSSEKDIRFENVLEVLNKLFDEVEPDGGWIDILDYFNRRLIHPGIEIEAKLAHFNPVEMPLTMLAKVEMQASEASAEKKMWDSIRPMLDPVKRILYINKSNTLNQTIASQIHDRTIDPEQRDLILHEMFHNVAMFSDEPIDSVHLFEHHQKVLSEFVVIAAEALRLQTRVPVPIPEGRSVPPQVTRSMLEDGTVFVGMPFKDEYIVDVYAEGVKEIIEQAGFQPVMLGERTNPGEIPKEIIEGIASASALIFDVTEPNPNVYYEVGLAHGYNKVAKTILIRNEEAETPPAFDTRHLRMLTYSMHQRKFREFRERLRNALKEISNLEQSSELTGNQEDVP